MAKREKWQSVKFRDPETGSWVVIESQAGCCPHCGQSRCTRRAATCLAVQAAIKAGDRTYFYV